MRFTKGFAAGFWICLLTAQTALGVPVFSGLPANLRTPQDLSGFMKKNFHYVSDGTLFGTFDHWQTPEEMLKARRGDCEDYAVFSKAVLESQGYRTFLLSVYWDEDAHTVAVFEKDGQWGIMNIDRFEFVETESLAKLASKIRKHWAYLGIMRQEGDLGLISRKFKRKLAEETSVSDILS